MLAAIQIVQIYINMIEITSDSHHSFHLSFVLVIMIQGSEV